MQQMQPSLDDAFRDELRRRLRSRRRSVSPEHKTTPSPPAAFREEPRTRYRDRTRSATQENHPVPDPQSRFRDEHHRHLSGYERSIKSEDDLNLSPPPYQRSKASTTQLRWHLSSILQQVFGIFSTLLGLLHTPIAIVVSVLLVLFFALYLYNSAMDHAVNVVCSIRGTSFLPLCKPITPVAHPLFVKVIKQESELANLQRLAADNAALPFMLLSGQSDVKDLIFEISAVDLPSKKKLMPLLGDYNVLLERVVDGIQDVQLKTDRLVDNTLSTYSWAEDQLERIDTHESSVMAPMHMLASKIGLPVRKLSSEQEVQETFYGYTDKLQKAAADTILEYQKTRGHLVEFRDLLDTLAFSFKEEGVILNKEKLGEESYWKWLLSSHRQKMHGFDQKMRLCAAFYRHTMEGGEVIKITIFKMQEMRGRIRELRDELAKAPLQLEGGGKTSLRLTIDAIKTAVGYLENSRTISRELRQQRMSEFERTITSSQRHGSGSGRY